jgi:hypothetical protein
MWKARPKSKVSRLKAKIRAVRRPRGVKLDRKQVAELVAALASAATALVAVAAVYKKLRK